MPNIHSPSQQHYQQLMQSGFAKPVVPTGIMENWAQARSMIMNENLSNSEKGVMMNYGRRRDATLLKLFQDGDIDPKLFNSFRDDSPTGFRGDLLARYLKNNTTLDVEDNDDLRKRIREDILVQKDYSEDVESRATWGGKLGQVLGTVTGYASDPLLWPTLVIGYGEAALGMRALAHIGVATLAEAGMETAIQYKTHKWRKQVSEASIKESIISIASVAGLTAGIGIGAKALSYGMKKWAKARGIHKAGGRVTARSWSEHKINQMIEEMDDAEFSSLLARKNLNADLRAKLTAERSAITPVEPGRLVRKGEAVQELKKGRVHAIAYNEDGSIELLLPAGDSVTIKLPTREASDAFVDQYGKHIITPSQAKKLETIAKKVVDKRKPITQKKAKAISDKGIIQAVEGYGDSLLIRTTEGKVYRMKFSSVQAREVFQKKLKSTVKPITAVEHAEKLVAEEKRLNSIGADTKVVEDTPDINKGKGATTTPVEKSLEAERSAVTARTSKEELSDSLDLAVEDLLKKNPDMELPIGQEIVEGETRTISKKTKDIFKQIDKDSELTNLFKECIVGR